MEMQSVPSDHPASSCSSQGVQRTARLLQHPGYTIVPPSWVHNCVPGMVATQLTVAMPEINIAVTCAHLPIVGIRQGLSARKAVTLVEQALPGRQEGSHSRPSIVMLRPTVQAHACRAETVSNL